MKLRDILGALVPGQRGKKHTQDMLENEYVNFCVWHSRKKYHFMGGIPLDGLDDGYDAEEVKENIEELLKFTAPLGGAQCEIVGCTVDVAKNPGLAAKLTGDDLDNPALIDARDDLARARARARTYREIDEAKLKLKKLPGGKVDEARGLVFVEPPCPDGREQRTITVSHGMEYRGNSGMWFGGVTYTPHIVEDYGTVTRAGVGSRELVNSLKKAGARGITVQELVDRSVARFYEKNVNWDRRKEEFIREGRIVQDSLTREVGAVDRRLKLANDQLLPLVSAQAKENMEKAGLLSNKARQLLDSTPSTEDKDEEKSQLSKLSRPTANYQRGGECHPPRTAPGGL